MKSRHFRRLAAITLLSWSLPATAQIAGTIETKSYPSTQGGKRIGCMIEFRTIVQDFTYRQGEPVVVSGSMGFMNYPGKQPAVTLKVVLDDMSPDGKMVDKTTVPPISISLVGADGESNAASQFMSERGDRPNSRIAAFSLDGFPEIFKRVLEQRELAVLFNRKNGGADVRVLADLTVEGLNDAGKPIRGTQTVAGFLACADKLLADIDADGLAK